MNSKLISIIIPIYNRAHLIRETLDSIIAQTYSNWECIIVDDGSFDGSREVVLQYIETDDRFVLYDRPSDKLKGPSSCRNCGFTFSKGNYIQFFDSDDIMHPDHLKEKIDSIGNADFVVCKLKEFYIKFNNEFNIMDEKEDNIYTDSIFEDFVMGSFPMMMVAPMWKRKSILPYMPIREDMNLLEDHELFARALFELKAYVIINKTLIFFRIGLNSLVDSFLKDIEFGISSFIEAKKTVLSLTKSKKVKISILKSTLSLLRLGIVQKKYVSCQMCLDFIKSENLCFNLLLKIKLIRIIMFYNIFKFFGRGETRLKCFLRFNC
jgi:glycosyltransferase involved in cell wall biosynthesis